DRPEFSGTGRDTGDDLAVSLAIMNHRYDYNTGSISKASLGTKGDPNSVGREYDKNGNLTKERWYGEDGRVVKDRHYTNHGNPKLHPKVPHDHDWGYDENGNWTPGPWYSTAINNIKISIGVAGGTYLLYRGIRMIPSLAPPLWWTIPANAVAP
ncbi:hypothetical protein LQK79_20625, partial [Clostridium guangxiense]|nr:hypothetical protein [Clostridium guangxiense]